MRDAIRYTITIEAILERVEKAGEEWQRKNAGEEPLPYWSYTPEIEKTVQRNVVIYKQTVDNINLVAVIKAVNNVG